MGRGFGGSNPQVGSSPDPHAQLVLQALAFHAMVTVWGDRGVLPDCWVALVAWCSPVPRLALRGGFSPVAPGTTWGWRVGAIQGSRSH